MMLKVEISDRFKWVKLNCVTANVCKGQHQKQTHILPCVVICSIEAH